MPMHPCFARGFLRGKAALVTGGGTGVGRGITAALLEHGCDVAIVSRRVDVLEKAARDLERSSGAGARCIPIPADVREPDRIESAVDQVIEAFGRLDIVINNAAGNFLRPASKLSYDAFRTILEIDTMGTFNVCKAAFAAYLRRHGGCIVNISSTLHYRGTEMQTHPVAAKAAVDALTRNLAIEWGPLGIRVNAIAPGPIADTEGMRRLLDGSARERFEHSIPLRRFGQTRDVANAALFLASDAASFVTGSILVVDGGSWMTMPTWSQL